MRRGDNIIESRPPFLLRTSSHRKPAARLSLATRHTDIFHHTHVEIHIGTEKTIFLLNASLASGSWISSSKLLISAHICSYLLIPVPYVQYFSFASSPHDTGFHDRDPVQATQCMLVEPALCKVKALCMHKKTGV